MCSALQYLLANGAILTALCLKCQGCRHWQRKQELEHLAAQHQHCLVEIEGSFIAGVDSSSSGHSQLDRLALHFAGCIHVAGGAGAEQHHAYASAIRGGVQEGLAQHPSCCWQRAALEMQHR